MFAGVIELFRTTTIYLEDTNRAAEHHSHTHIHTTQATHTHTHSSALYEQEANFLYANLQLNILHWIPFERNKTTTTTKTHIIYIGPGDRFV